MTLTAIRQFVLSTVADWRTVHTADLQFWHRSEARLALFALLALSIVLLIGRSALRRLPGRHQLAIPALLPSMRSSPLSFVRHLPLLGFLAGAGFLAIALGDPYTSLTSTNVTYPGRRIAVMIDASASMRTPFKAAHLNRRAETDAAFFTSVAAAERFVRRRMDGRYRDLVSLIEFGNEAYVVTPFTNDYENVLLSISLIGDPVEFMLFPDQGTIIAEAIQQGTKLFKAFNFLEASGNLMVIFSDGEDTRAIVNGKTLDEIVQSAIDAKIPVHLVRTNYERGKGKMVPDELWIPAIQKTGGRFYAADTEEHLLDAIKEIDQVSAGTIQTRVYTNQRPRFAMFAFWAVACWISAATAKVLVPQFQKLP